MKRSRFTEEQIIAVLKKHRAGLPVAELCRRHGMSDATFYNWKAKHGGLEVSRRSGWLAGEREREAEAAARRRHAGQRRSRICWQKKRMARPVRKGFAI